MATYELIYNYDNGFETEYNIRETYENATWNEMQEIVKEMRNDEEGRYFGIEVICVDEGE